MNKIQPLSFPAPVTTSDSLKPLDFDASPVTKFLTPDQRIAVARQRVSLQEVKQFAKLINSPGGMQIIAEDLQNYDYYPPVALRALNEKLIHDYQFGTICLLYSAIDQMIAHPARFEPKYNISKQNFDYHRIPISDTDPFFKSKMITIPLESKSPANSLLQQYFPATEEGLESVIAKMREYPESERNFWAFECPFGPLFTWSPLFHRLNEITSFFKAVNMYQQFGPNPFPPFQPQYLIVPSLSLLKAFATLALPTSYLQLQPGLGCFEKDDIIDYKKQGIRLVNIGMPGADCPESADDLHGGKYIFSVHDYYHYIRDCLTPRNYQLAINRISTLLEQLMLSQSDSPACLETKEIKWKLYDGEIFSFKMGENSGTVCNFGAIFERIEWSQIAKETVIKDMAQNRQLWHKEYDIT